MKALRLLLAIVVLAIAACSGSPFEPQDERTLTPATTACDPQTMPC